MIFTQSIHRSIYILALAITAGSLPFSVFATSVGSIILVVNFLLEGAWNTKFENARRNKLVWISLLVYLPIFYSSFYSANAEVAIRELRLWLPFLLFPPIVAFSNQLNQKEFKAIALFFVLAVFVATLISTAYLVSLPSQDAFDIRLISLFISHIRFALMINFAIAILIHFIAFDHGGENWQKGLMLLALVWLVIFLFILQSLTGFVMILLLIFLGFSWVYFKAKSSIQQFVLITAGLSAMFILISIATHKVDKFYTRNYTDFKKLPTLTANGAPYQHDTLRTTYENGNLIYINICSSELKKQWEQRSNLPFDSLDKKGQQLNQTILRYMTSLGLPKDSSGIWKLDQADIQLIETGATSFIFKESRFGVDVRIYQLLWELESYKNSKTIANSSVIQRLVFTKAAWFVISSHPWFGVGWGDILDSINKYYAENEVNLTEELRFMPHNQYLTVWAGAGIIGLVIFLSALVAPFVLAKKYKHFLPLYFFLMIMVSMLNEDTFETHIGITLAVLFGSMFIFGYSFIPKTDEPH